MQVVRWRNGWRLPVCHDPVPAIMPLSPAEANTGPSPRTASSSSGRTRASSAPAEANTGAGRSTQASSGQVRHGAATHCTCSHTTSRHGCRLILLFYMQVVRWRNGWRLLPRSGSRAPCRFFAPAEARRHVTARSAASTQGGCLAFANRPGGRPWNCGPLGDGQLRGVFACLF